MVHELVERNTRKAHFLPARARKLQQVTDQLIHPLRGADDRFEVRPVRFVKPSFRVALQNVREGADMAQRRAKIM